MFYLGLGKTLFNSSACLIQHTNHGPEIELVLSERLLRRKATGAWPESALRALEVSMGPHNPRFIAENRDVVTPLNHEKSLDQNFPFYDYLQAKGLAKYSQHFNSSLEFVSHHRCHAMAAVMMSPFARCIIVIMDGAGSRISDFPTNSGELLNIQGLDKNSHEECSAYLHDQGQLTCVYKRWGLFRTSKKNSDRIFSDGVGILYETVAEYIFNSSRAAGKLMGLASFGKASPIVNNFEFLEGLDWKMAFKGKSRNEWENNGQISFFADLAASVQYRFEKESFVIFQKIRTDFPSYDQIILSGGCALNCTVNRKISETELFREIYVPPFPGDECIALGAASHLYFTRALHKWQPFAPPKQHGYLGPISSIPTEAVIKEAFLGYEIVKVSSISDYAAELLHQNKIIAWFQGRSESGPRALGNRSILANPETIGLKDYLNREIKFREKFRPYGASCIQDSVSNYFQVKPSFDSPFMSYAVLPREKYRERLREVCHIDGTSRIQTVRLGQNPLFYQLLQAFGDRNDIPCLLNTSLNVMGEPIVETAFDARRFLDATPIYGIAIGDFFIRRAS